MHDSASPREARRRPGRYLGSYPHERPHQAPGYRAPAAVDGLRAASSGYADAAGDSCHAL
jgi:hypothetical protein